MISYVSDICGLPSSASSGYVALSCCAVLSAGADSRIWLARSVWENWASYVGWGCAFRSMRLWASASEMYDSEKTTSNWTGSG